MRRLKDFLSCEINEINLVPKAEKDLNLLKKNLLWSDIVPILSADEIV